MLTRPEPLGPHVVLFDGTARAPLGRYISDRLDPPAVDRGVVVPMRQPYKIGPSVLGRGASWRDHGPEAA